MKDEKCIEILFAPIRFNAPPFWIKLIGVLAPALKFIKSVGACKGVQKVDEGMTWKEAKAVIKEL